MATQRSEKVEYNEIKQDGWDSKYDDTKATGGGRVGRQGMIEDPLKLIKMQESGNMKQPAK